MGKQVEARLRQGLQPHGISARILRTKVAPAGSAPGLKCAGECLAAWLAGRGVAEEVRAGGLARSWAAVLTAADLEYMLLLRHQVPVRVFLEVGCHQRVSAFHDSLVSSHLTGVLK